MPWSTAALIGAINGSCATALIAMASTWREVNSEIIRACLLASSLVGPTGMMSTSPSSFARLSAP
jgi:hypothetical protein